MLAVFKKELKGYFNGPIAYIVVVFFLEFGTIWFLYVQQFLYQNVASMQGFFSLVPMLYVMVLPALTMRVWAEERRQGTDEVLLTLPITETAVVLGKFFASFFVVLLIAFLTLPLTLALLPLGDFQTGPLIGQYVGILLLGASGVAVGQFISGFASNQISAFLFSLIALLIITLVGRVNSLVNLPGFLAALLNYFSLSFHFQSFDLGILSSRDVLYFVLLTAFFLYLNVRVLVHKKWR